MAMLQSVLVFPWRSRRQAAVELTPTDAEMRGAPPGGLLAWVALPGLGAAVTFVTGNMGSIFIYRLNPLHFCLFTFAVKTGWRDTEISGARQSEI